MKKLERYAVRFFENGAETERFDSLEEAESLIDSYVEEDGEGSRDDWEIYDTIEEKILICKKFNLT